MKHISDLIHSDNVYSIFALSTPGIKDMNVVWSTPHNQIGIFQFSRFLLCKYLLRYFCLSFLWPKQTFTKQKSQKLEFQLMPVNFRAFFGHEGMESK